jgi:hypothetical protein
MFNELTVLVVYPHFLFQAIAIYLPPPAHPDKMQGLHIGFTSNFHIPVVIILATSQFIPQIQLACCLVSAGNFELGRLASGTPSGSLVV